MATTVLQPSLIAPRFMVKQYVIDNVSVAASSSTEASCNIEVDHYTTFGVLGIHIENASSSGNYWTRCAIIMELRMQKLKPQLIYYIVLFHIRLKRFIYGNKFITRRRYCS